MDVKKIKLIAMDLDGTLTQHKQPLDYSHRLALDMLKARYKLIMVGAGGTRRIFEQMGKYPIDIIGNYGLQYARYSEKEMDIETVRDLSFPIERDEIEKRVTLFREKYGFTEYKGDNVEYHASGCITFPILGTRANLEEKLAFDPDRKKRREIYDEVKEAFPEYNVFVGGSSSFDMSPKPYNKYYALDLYCRENGIAHSEVVYIGDDYGVGGNDESVYNSDFNYLKIDNYVDFPKIIAPLIKKEETARMEKERLEKIALAREYVEKLANGINPLDGTELPMDDIVNNVKISRCLFFVSDVLGELTKQAKRTSADKTKKSEFRVSSDIHTTPVYEYSVRLSEVVWLINSKKTSGVKKIVTRMVQNWLISIGMIARYTDETGKTRYEPTEAGLEIGIEKGEAQWQYGTYTVIMCKPSAQQFILDNVESLIEYNSAELSPLNHSKKWTDEEETKMKEMLAEGKSIYEIAYYLGRSVKATRTRLRRKYLIR